MELSPIDIMNLSTITISLFTIYSVSKYDIKYFISELFDSTEYNYASESSEKTTLRLEAYKLLASKNRQSHMDIKK